MRHPGIRRLLHAARLDTRGSVLVEFALLAPAFIMLLIGVLQVGVYVQNYNAIRTLAADVSRFAMIEYQNGRERTAEWIEQEAYATLASRSGANFAASRLDIDVDMVDDPNRSIAGMTEMEVKISYDSPDFLPFLDSVVSMSHSERVFLYVE